MIKRSIVFGLLVTPLFAVADPSCFTATEFGGGAGNAAKAQQIKDKLQEMKNPQLDLLGCFLNVNESGGNPASVKKECGCKQAIEKLCKKKHGALKAKSGSGVPSAWCAAFPA